MKIITKSFIILILLLSKGILIGSDMYQKSVSLQGFTFQVTANMVRPENTVCIKLKKPGASHQTIQQVIFGAITGVEVADLNADGLPEVYVFYTGDGSGSYGGFLAFTVTPKKSLSQIHLPDLLEDKKAGEGYLGHDEFSILENRLGRKFPVYLSGDTNRNPTGGSRVLYYRLVKGGAGWHMQLDKFLSLPREATPAQR